MAAPPSGLEGLAEPRQPPPSPCPTSFSWSGLYWALNIWSVSGYWLSPSVAFTQLITVCIDISLDKHGPNNSVFLSLAVPRADGDGFGHGAVQTRLRGTPAVLKKQAHQGGLMCTRTHSDRRGDFSFDLNQMSNDYKPLTHTHTQPLINPPSVTKTMSVLHNHCCIVSSKQRFFLFLSSLCVSLKPAAQWLMCVLLPRSSSGNKEHRQTCWQHQNVSFVFHRFWCPFIAAAAVPSCTRLQR